MVNDMENKKHEDCKCEICLKKKKKDVLALTYMSLLACFLFSAMVIGLTVSTIPLNDTNPLWLNYQIACLMSFIALFIFSFSFVKNFGNYLKIIIKEED